MSNVKIRAGQMIDGYQVQAQAPLEYITSERHRYIDGEYVKGAYRDPWWAYDPDRGWAIVKQWRHKAQRKVVMVPRAVAESGTRVVDIPAGQEIIAEPVAA